MIPDYDACDPKSELMAMAEEVRAEIEKLEQAAQTMRLESLAAHLVWLKHQQRKVWHVIAYNCDVKKFK